MPKRDPQLARSRLEALLSMGSSVAAEPLAGIAGLYGLATGGVDEGVRNIDKVRGKMTYSPRDPRGQQELARLLAPVAEKMEGGKRWLGDKALSATGSPAAAAAAYTAPDTILAALGARPALAAGRAASEGIGRAVARSAAMPGPAMGSPASQIGAIRAWHGSPHDFDRFSMDKIGTGEGAQAYGHGLYFAGGRDVAEYYRDALSLPRHVDRAALPVGKAALEEARAEGLDGVAAYQRANEILTSRAAAMDSAYPANRRPYYDAANNLEVIDSANGGKLYETELAPDETDLLDWDAPLSQQPEKVRASLDVTLDDIGLRPVSTDYGQYWTTAEGTKRIGSSIADRAAESGGRLPDNITGNDLNGLLHMALGSRGASQFLKQRGIPGIRYLDKFSRRGDGSRNYVMFDDSLVKILGKK